MSNQDVPVRRLERVSDQIAVNELVVILKTTSAAYLLIERDAGGYAVWPLGGAQILQTMMTQAAERLGPRILQLRLEQVPGLTEACFPVEQADPFSWAKRRIRQSESPAGCTVVLKNGRVVGILDAVHRGEYLSKLPGSSYLWLQVEEPRRTDGAERACGRCGAVFGFYDVQVVSGRPVYTCPICHREAEDLT